MDRLAYGTQVLVKAHNPKYSLVNTSGFVLEYLDDDTCLVNLDSAAFVSSDQAQAVVLQTIPVRPQDLEVLPEEPFLQPELLERGTEVKIHWEENSLMQGPGEGIVLGPGKEEHRYLVRIDKPREMVELLKSVSGDSEIDVPRVKLEALPEKPMPRPDTFAEGDRVYMRSPLPMVNWKSLTGTVTRVEPAPFDDYILVRMDEEASYVDGEGKKVTLPIVRVNKYNLIKIIDSAEVPI